MASHRGVKTDSGTLVVEMQKLRERLTAVREQHRKIEYTDGPYCAECADNWPCTTIQILDGTVSI